MKRVAIYLSLAGTLYSATAPSNLPPSGIDVEDAPLFIFLGSDDNYGTGMPVILDYLQDKVNPEGTGQAATFDGAPVRISFYSNSTYMTTTWMEWHRRALEEGHELGLHTDGHPHISSTEQAIQEIRKNRDLFGTGLSWGEPISFPSEVFTGFRAPYLDVSNHVFNALDELGLRYDCSVEDGLAPGVDIEDFNWPYTMDHGTNDGWRHLWEEGFLRDTAESHPGIWEIPAYPVFFIPDSLYSRYGVGEGYDDGVPMHKTYPYGEANESVDGKKMTGLDYDAWHEQHWSAHDFAMTLLYNLEQRLETNRVPLAFGIHAQYYSDEECMNGLKIFIDTALTYEDVRFVTGNSLIDWMENPVALQRETSVQKIPFVNQKNSSVVVSDKGLRVALPFVPSASYSIVTLSGREIAQGRVSDGEQIAFNGISGGIYLVHLNISGSTVTHKIVMP